MPCITSLIAQHCHLSRLVDLVDTIYTIYSTIRAHSFLRAYCIKGKSAFNVLRYEIIQLYKLNMNSLTQELNPLHKWLILAKLHV